jgi:hypothetical protein
MATTATATTKSTMTGDTTTARVSRAMGSTTTVMGGTMTQHNDSDGQQHNGRHNDGTGQHGDGRHDDGDERQHGDERHDDAEGDLFTY